jgi:hypothetical protein
VVSFTPWPFPPEEVVAVPIEQEVELAHRVGLDTVKGKM